PCMGMKGAAIIKTLVITEKPSVAIDISKVLGGFSRHDGYLESSYMIITWAVGHLVELAMPQDYDPALAKWKIDSLPIIPKQFKLLSRKSTEKQLNIIKSLITRPDVENLINACDPAREGELIYIYIIKYLNCKKPYKRLWLSETTDEAIKHAFANLRSSREVVNLAKAAISRSQSDWLIGLNATRGFTIQNDEKLTVGRVQTPTLALIVNREREIENFTPEPYWELLAHFNTGTEIYSGKWFKGKKNRFVNEAEVQSIQNKLIPGTTATVTKVEQKEFQELPPQLFSLNDLQKEANKKFSLTAEQTLNIVQKLYEAKLLTYPRTDSRHLTKAMAKTIPNRLKALHKSSLSTWAEKITTIPTDKRYVDDTKVSDHTAIIITDTIPQPKAMPEGERNIYLLVARRLISIFYPPHKTLKTSVVTTIESETFLSKGKAVVEQGWKAIYLTDDDKNDSVMPVLTKGQNVVLEKTEVATKETNPPKRLNDADLLSAMENAGKHIDDEALRDAMKGKGLGTPATRAAIIEKLIKVKYIERHKKTLVPTDKGKHLIDIVPAILKDPALTGEWEKKLLDIEQGNYNSAAFMTEIKQLTTDIINEAKSRKRIYKTKPIAPEDVLGTCPICGQPVIESKKGYGCSAWRGGCKFTIWKEIAGKKISRTQAEKLLKNGKSDLIKGFKSKKGKDFDAYLKLVGARTFFEFPAKV
ncbi:MAG: DNA topoisomerase 3, partial [Syntrophomonadaceae bacterium]|nr:DNA topoisomerase 3 [Syntrophomonadaceae bacterium]